MAPIVNAWPDTTDDPIPAKGNPWRAARWLVGRYPRMQVLCERVGAIDDDEEGRWPDVDKLADIIRASDAFERAWEAYSQSYYPPEDAERYRAWEAKGPHPADFCDSANLPPHTVHAFGVMSGGEKRMLRILATLSPHRVEFSATSDTTGLDEEGHFFVLDWLAIISR